MNKITFTTYLIPLIAVICCSFKTDQIQPNRDAKKYHETLIPQNEFSTLNIGYFSKKEPNAENQFNRLKNADLIKPHQTITTSDTVTATGVQISSMEYHGTTNGERVFFFEALADQGLPCYFTIKVSNYNNGGGTETVTDSEFEYQLYSIPDGTLYYMQLYAISYTAGQHIVYGAVQQVTLGPPSSHVTWEVAFSCQSGTASITLIRAD